MIEYFFANLVLFQMLNYYIHVSVPLITDFNYVRVYHCSIDTSCKISYSKRMEARYA